MLPRETAGARRRPPPRLLPLEEAQGHFAKAPREGVVRRTLFHKCLDAASNVVQVEELAGPEEAALEAGAPGIRSELRVGVAAHQRGVQRCPDIVERQERTNFPPRFREQRVGGYAWRMHRVRKIC